MTPSSTQRPKIKWIVLYGSAVGFPYHLSFHKSTTFKGAAGNSALLSARQQLSVKYFCLPFPWSEKYTYLRTMLLCLVTFEERASRNKDAIISHARLKQHLNGIWYNDAYSGSRTFSCYMKEIAENVEHLRTVFAYVVLIRCSRRSRMIPGGTHQLTYCTFQCI